MLLIERYVLRRAGNAFLLTLAALVGTLWVTQLLRELDVVTAKGQAIWIYLLMTLLALPGLVQIVAPVALLVAAIVTLNALTVDSEFPVISGAGAARSTVNRPLILLATLVMLAVAFSQHILAPASLSALRAILTRVRADVIATLVQDGGFRSVEQGLTMHIREKGADGSFRGIFVSDERGPAESLQYSANEGVLLERGGQSFLVLRDGDLIREDRVKRKSNVVAFQTYALDLSQLAPPSGVAVYRAKERSTFYLAAPPPGDDFTRQFPERVTAEIHDRATAPLYALLFVFIALAFLGRPRSSRQDRSFAIAAIVLLCIGFRAAGFAAVAIARSSAAGIPLMYFVPLAGIAFGAYSTLRDLPLRFPRWMERVADAAIRAGERAINSLLPDRAVGGRRS